MQIPTAFRLAKRDEELYLMEHRDLRVLWIPDNTVELQQRVLVCGHMREAGHRGVEVATAAASVLRVEFIGGGREEVREVMLMLRRL